MTGGEGGGRENDLPMFLPEGEEPAGRRGEGGAGRGRRAARCPPSLTAGEGPAVGQEGRPAAGEEQLLLPPLPVLPLLQAAGTSGGRGGRSLRRARLRAGGRRAAGAPSGPRERPALHTEHAQCSSARRGGACGWACPPARVSTAAAEELDGGRPRAWRVGPAWRKAASGVPQLPTNYLPTHVLPTYRSR